MTLLEKLSNFAVIVGVVFVIAINIYPRASRQKSLPSLDAYLGKVVNLPGVPPSASQPTVALFVSKDCHFCTDSMDFYRRLTDLSGSPARRFRVVAVGPKNRESKEDLEKYLARQDLKVDVVTMANFSELKISGTPTLLLQDGSGKVLGAWSGYLPEPVQSEVGDKLKKMLAD
jgi:hypothetical protein